jgi:C1A family cysteine protease
MENIMAKKFIPKQSLGWMPDLPDARDLMFSANAKVLKSLKPAVDLRPKFKFEVYDQGRIGSCTANAIAAAIQFDRKQAGQTPDFTPSRLFIYYNERDIEKSIPFDAGAQIRDGIKSAAKLGVCKEATWPYDDTAPPNEDAPFPAGAPAAQRPPKTAYDEAKNFQLVSYMRLIRGLSQLRSCIAEGYPFVFGFTVYESFWDIDGQPRTTAPLPNLAKDKVAGGHAVLAVGYDDAKQVFIIRNSWGSGVQDQGHFYMPYSYVTDAGLCDDFWTIRTIES